MKLTTKITAITMTLVLEYLSRSSLFIKFIFKNYKAGYLPLYFAFRQLLQSLWKIPVSSVLLSQKVFSASFNSFWQTSQMSKMYPDFDSYTIRIKKFSSPKIKIWFEPMFFYGFFCGFQRCGSAAFPNFRGGISSPPQAAKCVRTNSRILHHIGKVKEFWFASLRSAMILYSILGAKTNWRFRILGEENFLILNF